MYNFEFKKSLGQNFLKDKNVVNKIVDAVLFEKNNLVIEIGPGSGALTKELLKKSDMVLLYEIDTRLEKILQRELVDYSNYELIFGDFLTADVCSDLRNYSYDHLYIVANLPYYITTPIISKIINDNINAEKIVIMVQKEVADRLSAGVGSKEYGQITVFLNYFFDVEKIINVSKNSFIPKPKVDSAVIRMTLKKEKEEIIDLKFFEKMVKDSFKYKRKTIKNNLKEYDLNVVEKVLWKHGFTLDSRSESIPYYVFVELSNELYDK